MPVRLHAVLRQGGFVYLGTGDLGAPRSCQHEREGLEKKYVYRTAHQMRFPQASAEAVSVPRRVRLFDSSREADAQCRTFPFWPEIVERRATWKQTGRSCPGIGKGELIQIGSAMEIAEEQRTAYPEMYKR